MIAHIANKEEKAKDKGGRKGRRKGRREKEMRKERRRREKIAGMIEERKLTSLDKG